MKFKEGDKIQIVKPFMRMGRNYVGSVGIVLEHRCYGGRYVGNEPTHYVVKFDCYKVPHIFMRFDLEDSCELIESSMKSYTDIEQSKKLAEILPLESADNVIVSFGSREGTKTVIMPKETLDVIRTPFSDIREVIPCWSLAALLGVLPEGYSFELTKSFNGKDYYCNLDGKPIETMADNPIDACYEIILKLHELNLLWL